MANMNIECSLLLRKRQDDAEVVYSAFIERSKNTEQLKNTENFAINNALPLKLSKLPLVNFCTLLLLTVDRNAKDLFKSLYDHYAVYWNDNANLKSASGIRNCSLM